MLHPLRRGIVSLLVACLFLGQPSQKAFAGKDCDPEAICCLAGCAVGTLVGFGQALIFADIWDGNYGPHYGIWPRAFGVHHYRSSHSSHGSGDACAVGCQAGLFVGLTAGCLTCLLPRCVVAGADCVRENCQCCQCQDPSTPPPGPAQAVMVETVEFRAPPAEGAERPLNAAPPTDTTLTHSANSNAGNDSRPPVLSCHLDGSSRVCDVKIDTGLLEVRYHLSGSELKVEDFKLKKTGVPEPIFFDQPRLLSQDTHLMSFYILSRDASLGYSYVVNFYPMGNSEFISVFKAVGGNGSMTVGTHPKH